MSSSLCCSMRALELRASKQTLQHLPIVSRRAASHQSQGRANGAKQGAGRRLGAKKTGGEYVVTGNILYRQRGTLWFPGDNCFMGRDHTIHAALPGYVRYYRDPLRHPKRKYIGVALGKDQELPQPAHAPRARRLGMLAYQIPASTQQPAIEEPSISNIPRRRKKSIAPLRPTLQSDYSYRVSNWSIGREAERVGTAQRTIPAKPGNRWRAWRKRSERRAKAIEKRALGRGGKKKPVKM